MSYLALYRAFRPSTFDEIIGQEHIVRTLVNQIKTDKIGHAYLFCGARGTGKTTAAKVFARAINCMSPVNGSPCGHCEACKKLASPSNLDILEMDAASNNKVENVRDIRDKIQYPPVAGKYKVYIIDEVHMLTPEAFNALLKTLEEPPSHAVFILATTEVHKIPATILSRCLRFDFKLIPTKTIAELIGKIYDKIGKKYTPEAVNAIARAGEGSVRDALSVADVCVSFSNDTLTYDDVIEVLGASDRVKIEAFIAEITRGDVGGILSSVEELCMQGKSVSVLNRDVCGAIRDLLVIKTCADPNAVLGLPEDKLEALKKLADGTDGHALLRYLEIFSAAEADLKYSTHPRIVFETAAVKAGMPQADYNVDALISRVSALEKKLGELAARPVTLPSVDMRPVNVGAGSPAVGEKQNVQTTAINSGKVAAAAPIVGAAAKPSVGTSAKSSVGAVESQKSSAENARTKPASAYDDNAAKPMKSAKTEFDDIPPEEEQGFYFDGAMVENEPKKESFVGGAGSDAKSEVKSEVKAEEKIEPKSEAKSSSAASAKPSVKIDNGGAVSGDNKENAEKAWGAMLRAMRKDKEIMLWAACEDVDTYASGTIFCIKAPGDNEYVFLSKPENVGKLRNYAVGEGYSDVKIVTSNEAETEEEFGNPDLETKKVETLFQGEKLTIKD